MHFHHSAKYWNPGIKNSIFKTLLLSWIFYVSLSTSTKVRAQEVMDLSQCIDYSLIHNPSITSSKLDEENARVDTKRIAASGYPQINAYGSFDDNIKIPVTVIPAQLFEPNAPPGTVIPVRFGVQYSTVGYVQLDQLIYQGTYWVGLKASKVSRLYYSQATQQVVESTIYNVSAAYFRALIAIKQAAIQESNANNSKELFNIVDLQYNNGVATKTDRDRILVDYNNQLTSLRSMQRDIESAMNNLKFQMGMPVDESLSIKDIEKDTSEIFKDIPDLQMNNFSQRPDYRLMQTQRQLNMLQVKQYQANRQPVLTGYGRYQYQAYRTKFNFFDPNKPWFNSEAIGLRLTVPIFHGFQNTAQIQQAKISLVKTELNLKTLEQRINLEVSNAKSSYLSSVDNTKLAGSNILLAQEVYNAQILSYKEGVGNYSDYLNANNSLKSAELNYITSLYNAYLAKLELAKAQGKLNEVLEWGK